MDLNEIHSDQEQASVSLKVVLLIFGIVLIGALAYLVGYQNKTQDDTDYTAPPVKSQAVSSDKATTDSGQTTLSNETYKFSITYPSSWKLTNTTSTLGDTEIGGEASVKAYYQGMTAAVLALPEGGRDINWTVSIQTGKIADRIAYLRSEANSFVEKVTDLTESTKTINNSEVKILSYKQGASTRAYYFYKSNNYYAEVHYVQTSTDNTPELVTVAESFKYTN